MMEEDARDDEGLGEKLLFEDGKLEKKVNYNSVTKSRY